MRQVHAERGFQRLCKQVGAGPVAAMRTGSQLSPPTCAAIAAGGGCWGGRCVEGVGGEGLGQCRGARQAACIGSYGRRQWIWSPAALPSSPAGRQVHAGGKCPCRRALLHPPSERADALDCALAVPSEEEEEA